MAARAQQRQQLFGGQEASGADADADEQDEELGVGDQPCRLAAVAGAVGAGDDGRCAGADAAGERKQEDRDRKGETHRRQRLGADDAQIGGFRQPSQVHRERTQGHERAEAD